MKKIILGILFPLILSSCVAPQKIPIERTFAKSYKIGEVERAPIGSPMLSIANLYYLPSFQAIRDFDVPHQVFYDLNSIKRGMVFKIFQEHSDKYLIQSTEFDPHEQFAIMIKKDGTLYDEKPLFNVVLAGIPAQKGWQAGNIRLFERAIDVKGSYKMELIYTGSSKRTVNLVYREYIDDFVRPAFFQELKYDLDSSKTITFRTIKIEIIDANNSEIVFKVLDEGNLNWLYR